VERGVCVVDGFPAGLRIADRRRQRLAGAGHFERWLHEPLGPGVEREPVGREQLGIRLGWLGEQLGKRLQRQWRGSGKQLVERERSERVERRGRSGLVER
jgi:hypothetical protein